jgi:hypothetical protein
MHPPNFDVGGGMNSLDVKVRFQQMTNTEKVLAKVKQN